MENIDGMSSFATEPQLKDFIELIESAENTMDRYGSLECSESNLDKVTGMSQQHITTTSGVNENSSIQIEMDTDESIEGQSEEMRLELMDLNDDCLRTIFEQLPILDLTSVADVCKRFRLIAQEVFEFAKPIVQIPLDVCRRKYKYVGWIADEDKSELIRRASRLFRNFGSLMTELEVESISEAPYEQKIVAIIIKYCDGNLIAFKLHLMETRKLPIGLKPIIGKLKKANFNCYAGIDKSVFEWLTVVEDLTLDSRSRKLWHALFKRSFEHLRRIRFVLKTKILCHEFAMFLDKHKTIKEMDIEGLEGADSYKLKIPAQMENLKLDIFRESFRCIESSSFRNLKSLNSLELHNDREEPNFVTAIIRELVAGQIPLKHLTLAFISFSRMNSDTQELCDVLSKLDYLDTFTLNYPRFENVDEFEQLLPMLHSVTELHLDADSRYDTMFTIDELVTIVSYLHNLQRLKISVFIFEPQEIFSFDLKAFERFVTIVQNRNNKTCLNIEFDADCYKLEIPDDLAQQHRHIPSVREHK